MFGYYDTESAFLSSLTDVFEDCGEDYASEDKRAYNNAKSNAFAKTKIDKCL